MKTIPMLSIYVDKKKFNDQQTKKAFKDDNF